MQQTVTTVLLLTISLCARAVEPPLGTRIVHPADGALMAYVPAGEFVMGMDQKEADQVARDLGFKDYTELWAWETFPKRAVYVAGFFVDVHEVTVERWRKFAAAHPELTKTPAAPTNLSEKPEDQMRAAGGILWAQAQQYANWCGKALPTEAQWEKAARGTDGRPYPWGNEPPGPERMLMKLTSAGDLTPHVVGDYPKGASPCGALDMLGNEYEWTRDWAEPYPNNPEAARMIAYTGHQNGCLRGGSTYHGPIGFYAAKRMGFPPGETHFHVGFRTIWEPPAGYFESDAFKAAQDAVPRRVQELEALRRSAPPATMPSK
jgi:formylglycine-generating enzyme required for sulfatase activity